MEESSAWRRRITLALDDVTTPLTVLHAGCGTGKTTALTLWTRTLRAAGHRVLWVTLGPETDTPAAVWNAAVEATHATDLPVSLVKELRDASTRSARREALRDLARAVPDLTVILDGCEFVTDRPERLWRALVSLSHLHTSTRVVAVSRWLPSETVTALRLDPTATIVPATVLAPRPDEVRQILEAHGPGVSDALVEDVVTRTRGNLRLVAAAALQRADGTETPDWDTLLSAEARRNLERLEMPDAGVRLAWLPVLDAHLLALCTGRPAAQAGRDLLLLETLGLTERAATTPNGPMFEWAAALRTTHFWQDCTHHPQLDVDVRERAIDHLAGVGCPGDELVAALRSGSWERAGTLHTHLLISAPEEIPEAATHALARMPLDTLLGIPLLAAARGLTLRADPSTRAAANAYLRPLAEAPPSLPGAPGASTGHASPDATLATLTLTSRVLLDLDEPEQATAQALRAADLLHEPDFVLRCDPALVASAACQLSIALYEGGHPERAQECAAFGFTVAPDEHRYACAVHARVWYGIHGDFRAAAAMDAHALTHRPRARPAHLVRGTSTAQFDVIGQCLMLFERFDLTGIALLLQSDDAREGDIWDTADTLLRWTRVALSLTNRSYTQVASLATPPLEAQQPVNRRSVAALTMMLSLAWFASAEVARGRSLLTRLAPDQGEPAVGRFIETLLLAGPDEALASLTRLQALPGHSLRSRAVLATLGTATALRIDDLARARRELGEVVALHEQHGVRSQLVMIDATDVAAILALCRTLDSPGVTALVDGLEAMLPADQFSSLRPVLLTEREEAVLVELIHQPSRKQIAAVLHVSENTVKTQLRSLYRKLEVDDRSAALTRAAALGLIPSP